MDILLVVLLVVVGVGLLLVELFLLPGFSVAGIASLLCLAGSVVAAYFYLGALAGHITLGVALVACALAIWIFMRNRTLEKMALKTDITSKVDLIADSQIAVGDTGVCVSRLAPMGKVRINNQEFEAKSQDEFLDAETEVEVLAIDGNKLIVRAK